MLKYAENPGGKDTLSLAIFASGTGSNAQKIIDYFRGPGCIRVSLLVCNNPDAYVLQIAASENIPSLIIKRERFFNGDAYLPELQKNNIAFIALAGFLWKIPDPVIEAYPNTIVNIHPALLPAYGGKNMYGIKVHEAVIRSGDKESGITIHYVDGEYDNGDIIFQKKCTIDKNDTAETLAQKIHRLEHENYAPVIEKLIKNNPNRASTDIDRQ